MKVALLGLWALVSFIVAPFVGRWLRDRGREYPPRRPDEARR